MKTAEELTKAEAEEWQHSWDAQQEGYLPDREERFSYMIGLLATWQRDAGENRGRMRVIDLACGCGSLTARILRTFPTATAVGVDIDPVLLAIYESYFSGDDRASHVRADLANPDWSAAAGLSAHGPFDAVVTATALHWLPAATLERVYSDVAGLLRPGGIFINADHAPLPGVPTLAAAIAERREAERVSLAGARDSWEGWWERVAADPALAPLYEERRKRFPEGHSEEFKPAESWHLAALAAARFSEVASVWRRGDDAMLAAVR